MLDVLIRGAAVLDGTGAPARQVDVGVRAGRIVLGADGPAEVEVDAGGLTLAPGFVDVHTHYDAQLMWDPSASPSPLHGVTSVFGGNCGFSLAPARASDLGYLKHLMSRVEGMPLTALEEGLAWDWTDYPDWLNRFENRLGVNAGFLVGHTALRKAVMGDAAGEPATADQVDAMVRLLREALRAGGLGFSTSLTMGQLDGDGRPVPSNYAEPEEILALAATVREFPGTTVGLVPNGTAYGVFSDDEVRLMADVSLAADRPVNWNVLRVSSDDPSVHENQLEVSDRAAARGGRVLALTIPHPQRMRLDFLGRGFLDALPGWRDVLHLPVPERLAALRDPAVRNQLRNSAAEAKKGILHATADWENVRVAEVYSAANAGLEGRTVGQIAAERGAEVFEVLCDIVVADELRTGLEPQYGRDTPEENKMRADVWQDERTIVGGSDAGAHLDVMCGAIATTAMLSEAVRDQRVISLEAAVHQLTDVPARVYGLTERGRIEDGWHADLVLFDPETVGWRTAQERFDLPGGAPRLYSEATGIEKVWVNGTVVADHGELTGAIPGRLLRSGRDTETVHVPGNHQ